MTVLRRLASRLAIGLLALTGSGAFSERVSDCYVTPPSVVDFVYDFWPRVDLDPFYDPQAILRAREWFDIRNGEDAYELPWYGDTVFVNGPYSGKNPARTAEKCKDECRRSRGREILSLCPAAPGSTYWKEHVWGTAAAVAWLGRLSFIAGRDIVPEKGRVIRAGELVHGNRTEIALLFYGSRERAREFVRMARERGWAAQLLEES